MAEQAYAYVTLIPVAKGFKSAISKELNAGAGVGATAGASAGKGFSGGFGKALGGLAAVAGTALAGIGISKFFKDSIIQASDLGESVNAINVAFGDSAKGILDFGKTSAKELGVAQVDFNNAAVRFSAFADRIVGAGNDSSQFIGDVTTRAADFASVFNIDVSEALQVFQSGLAGEAEPLKRFGINLLDSEVKAYAMANGIGTVGKELTETEKVQARYGLLMESTSKVQGDFQNTSDGLANSQRILKSTFKDLQAEVGENLTPVMATFSAALVPLAEKVFPAIADFVNTRIVPGLELFAQYFSDLVLIGTTLGADNVFAKIFDDISTAITNFFTGDNLGKLFTGFVEMRSTLINAFIEVIPGIVGAIAQIIPNIIATLAEMIPTLLDAAVETFTALVDAVIEVIPIVLDAILGMLPQLVQTIISLLPSIISAGIELFKGLVNALVAVIPDIVKEFAKQTPVILDAIIDALPLIIDAGFDLFAGLIQGLIEATPDIIDAVVELIPVMVQHLMDNLPKLVEAGIELVKGLVKGIVDNGPRLLGEAIGTIGNTLVNGVKDFLGIKSPSRVFMEIGEDVGQGLVNGMESTAGAVAKAADKLAKAAIPPGYEMVMGPNGPYLEFKSVTSGKSGKSAGSGFGAASASFLLRQQGLSQAEIDRVLTDTIGGTLNQVNATMNKGVTLINEATNTKIVGNLTAADVTNKMAQGFKVVEKIAAPVEDLEGAINDLISTIQSGNTANVTPFAKGGLVTGPTRALIGEAGPEVVIPLDRFESMMGMSDSKSKTVNYYAAPNQSIDSEQALFQAMRRAKVVANW